MYVRTYVYTYMRLYVYVYVCSFFLPTTITISREHPTHTCSHTKNKHRRGNTINSHKGEKAPPPSLAHENPPSRKRGRQCRADNRPHKTCDLGAHCWPVAAACATIRQMRNVVPHSNAPDLLKRDRHEESGQPRTPCMHPKRRIRPRGPHRRRQTRTAQVVAQAVAAHRSDPKIGSPRKPRVA